MLARLTAKAWLAVMALTWFSLGAHAAGDPAKGEMKFYTCYGCHGIANYRNAYPDYSVPKLRHQNAEYLTAALHEYRDGTRPHATMHAQASSLSDQDIEDIAAYLQGAQPIKAGTPRAGQSAAQTSCGLRCLPRRNRPRCRLPARAEAGGARRTACGLPGAGADLI